MTTNGWQNIHIMNLDRVAFGNGKVDTRVSVGHQRINVV